AAVGGVGEYFEPTFVRVTAGNSLELAAEVDPAHGTEFAIAGLHATMEHRPIGREPDDVQAAGLERYRSERAGDLASQITPMIAWAGLRFPVKPEVADAPVRRRRQQVDFGIVIRHSDHRAGEIAAKVLPLPLRRPSAVWSAPMQYPALRANGEEV